MKKLMKYGAFAALATLALVQSGCMNVDEEITLPNGDNLVTVNVVAEEHRSELGEDGASVTWSDGDQIGVFYYTKNSAGKNTKHADNKPYTATIKEGVTKFTGDIAWAAESYKDDSQNFQAYFPYNADVTSASKAYGELPAEQTYDPAGWNISDYDFMVSGTDVATYGKAVTISLYHLFSILRINITNGTSQELVVEKVKISAEDENLILAGKFEANIGKSKDYQALHNSTTQTGTDGYFTAPSSEVSTSVVDGAVAAGEALDVRLMINAGMKEDPTTDYYLDGQKLQLEIYTTGNPVWKTEITGGQLARGARAVKKVTINGFEAGGDDDTPTLTVSSITPDYDATSERFYLNTIATLSGANLPAVTKLTVDGKEVPATGLQASATQITFRIPDTIEGNTAKECAIVATTTDNKTVELGKIKVYPFFYYKDVQLGLGSDSSKTYTEYAAQNSIFVPDLGRVISAAEWRSMKIDNFAVDADEAATANPALSAKNTLDKTQITAEEYYAIKPYYFFVANTSQVLSMAAPSNSDSVLRNHHIAKDGGGYSVLMNNKLYGTPIIWYRTLATDSTWSQAVVDGTLESIAAYNGTRPSASAPTFGTATADGGTWTEGAVIITGYTTYTKGAKPSSLKDYAKLGFIHIKEITCADLATGLAKSPREGHIKFDFYWSKPLNDAASQPLYGDDNDAPLSPSVPPTPPTEGGEDGDDTEDGEHTVGTHTISSVAELEAIKPLRNGDVIVWKNGTYNNVNITLTSEGELTDGIVFRAESNGGVIFTGNSTLQINSSNTTIKGFHWKDPVTDSEHLVRFMTGTSNSTLTECVISGDNTAADYTKNCKWVSLQGSGHTVKNCSFVNKRDRGALMVVWFDEGVTPFHTIKNNYFTRPEMLIDPNDGDPANEQETIRIGDSANSLKDGKVTVSGNYFYRCWGESAEVVSSKSCANTYSGNYFHECRGTLTMRHGNSCTVEGNYFLGNGVEESGGVRIIGEDHIVRNNHFESLTGIGYKAALSLVRGQENAALSGYAQVKGALVENNVFNECTLAMHVNYGGSNMTLPVVDSTIRNNTLVSTNDSNYIVRCENTATESTINWEGNTLYGRIKNNVFSLSTTKTLPTLEDVSAKRNAIASAAGASWD